MGWSDKLNYYRKLEVMHRLKVEEWELSRVKAYENNAKLHPDWQVEQIADSIEEFGMLDPIAVDEHGEILEGHGRLLAAQKRGDVAIPVIQVLGLTDAQKVAYRLAHNKLTMNTEFDLDLLQEDIKFLEGEEIDIDLTGFSDEDLDFGSGDSGGEGEGKKKEPKDPEIPEVVESRVKPGEIWKLGRHYIACGDCTVESNIKELLEFVDGRSPDMVWADPPYGINIVRSSDSSFGGSNIASINKYAPVHGDNTTDIAVNAALLYLQVFKNSTHFWWGANYYASNLPDSRCWLIWDKQNSGDFADAEMAWSNQETSIRIFRHTWNGMIKDSEHGEKRVHPTQKPVALPTWCFEKYGTDEDLVIDPFLGSGVSLLAAEQMEGDRTVIGFELSEHYCEIICRRFEQISDEVPQLVGRLGNTPTPEQLAELGF